jgi:hypothetical protein
MEVNVSINMTSIQKVFLILISWTSKKKNHTWTWYVSVCASCETTNNYTNLPENKHKCQLPPTAKHPTAYISDYHIKISGKLNNPTLQDLSPKISESDNQRKTCLRESKWQDGGGSDDQKNIIEMSSFKDTLFKKEPFTTQFLQF